MSSSPPFDQPFPGLRPYDIEDAGRFFGRHTHVAEMIALLERQRFLAVIGASGSGKSSLVRAGLLPTISNGYLAVDSNPDDDVWRIVITRPGDDPYGALAESLVKNARGDALSKDAHAKRTEDTLRLLRSSQFGLAYALRDLGIVATDYVVLLVDQFEELFRFRREDLQRRHTDIADEISRSELRNDANAFVNLLLKSTEPTEPSVFVILTMRSDFLGDCDAFIGLPEAISRSQYLTPRLTRSQLEEAIRSPLRLFETHIEEALVTRILNDIGTEPDQLPLMQHALMRAWKHARARASMELRINDYEDVGGVHGALNQHANEILAALGDETTRKRLQHVAFRLFCSLSERRDGGPLTRRPIRVAQAAQEAGAAESDIATVARAFHAANLLVFSPPDRPLEPTTRLDISHESLLRQWRQLESWIDTESKSALSYRRLMDAIRSGEPTLSDTHLAQAQEWVEREHPNPYWAMRYDNAESAEKSLLPRCEELIDRSRAKRERQLQAERDAVEREQARVRREAEAEARRAREAEASAVREQQLQQEKAEVEAQRARDAEAATRRGRLLMWTAVAACVVAVIFLFFAMKNLQNAKTAEKKAISSQKAAETQQAEANRQNEKHYWQFAILARDSKEANPIKASHLFLRGADALSQIRMGKTSDVQGMTRDGAAASAVDHPLVRSWIHDSVILGAQFSRDEARVLTWSGDKTARLWEVGKAEPLQTFTHGASVYGAQFSRDEARVLTWSGDKTARLWEVGKAEPLQTFTHGASVNGAQFSRDEARVLTWSGDKTARLWEVGKAEPLQTFTHGAFVYGAQFSRDEARVLTWSRDETARLWDSTDPLATLTPAERILELEVRSGATLDEQLNLRTLKFDEWQTKVKATAYRTIQEKLAPARLDRKQ